MCYLFTFFCEIQGMLATCIGTASYCFLLVGLMFIKETLVHWASAQRQGRALVSQSQMLEVCFISYQFIKYVLFYHIFQ